MEVMTGLPLLVTWGVWLARNNIIFNEKLWTPSIIASLACGIIHAFLPHIWVSKQWEVLALDIDRTAPWGFFYGASQNNICGGGDTLLS